MATRFNDLVMGHYARSNTSPKTLLRTTPETNWCIGEIRGGEAGPIMRFKELTWIWVGRHAGADKSGLEMHYATFGYASLWLMQRGDGRGEPAPTGVSSFMISRVIYERSSSAMCTINRHLQFPRNERMLHVSYQGLTPPFLPAHLDVE